jgi:hypothetical protein
MKLISDCKTRQSSITGDITKHFYIIKKRTSDLHCGITYLDYYQGMITISTKDGLGEIIFHITEREKIKAVYKMCHFRWLLSLPMLLLQPVHQFLYDPQLYSFPPYWKGTLV